MACAAALRRGAESASRTEGATDAAEVVLLGILGGVSETMPQKGRALAQPRQNHLRRKEFRDDGAVAAARVLKEGEPLHHRRVAVGGDLAGEREKAVGRTSRDGRHIGGGAGGLASRHGLPVGRKALDGRAAVAEGDGQGAGEAVAEGEAALQRRLLHGGNCGGLW